jgi:hypothetical protein
MTPRLSSTAYQNSRLRNNSVVVEGAGLSTHFCVDLTIEKPRFSRVWKLKDTSTMGLRAITGNVLFLCSFDVHEHAIEAEYALL